VSATAAGGGQMLRRGSHEGTVASCDSLFWDDYDVGGVEGREEGEEDNADKGHEEEEEEEEEEEVEERIQ
jgi:hypothetical protein